MVFAPSLSMRAAALLVAALLAMAALLSTGATNAFADDDDERKAIPVRGTLSDGGTFKGEIEDPVVEEDAEGNLSLSGLLKGRATTADGEREKVKQRFTAPLEASSGAAPAGGEVSAAAPPDGCSIINLDLGPLDLDILGLVVNLAPVSLDVTAVPGAGNLLGNLLCSVAGLLDGAGLLELLQNLLTADFLNDLLDALLGQ